MNSTSYEFLIITEYWSLMLWKQQSLQTENTIFWLFSVPLMTRWHINWYYYVQKAAKVPVLRRNKAPTSILIVIHFSAVMKTLVLGNLFKLLRFAITFTSSFPLRIMRRITPLSYFLHFFKPQVANFPQKCDGQV